jgi:hypothetical protein
MRIGIILGFLLAAGCAQAAEPGWSTYNDAKHGFSLSYPPGWRVDPAHVDKGYGYFQGDRDDVRDGVAFMPTADIAPGTNLESDQLALIIEPARPADRCVASAFLVDPPPDNATQTIVEKPDAVQTLAAAGDLYSVEHIAIIASHAPCIAVHYVIYSRQIGRNDPAATKPFDRAMVIGLLNKIASTLAPAK